MNLSFYFLLFSLVFGQLLSVSFGTVRISILDLAVASMVVTFIIQRRSHLKAAIELTNKSVGAFIIVCVVSLLASLFRLSFEQVVISSFYLLRFMAYFCIVPIIALTKIKNTKEALWFSGVSIALFGWLQYFLYPNLRNLSYLGWDPHQYRIFSTFLDPNFTGIILVLTLLLGLNHLQLVKKPNAKKLIIAGSIIVGCALLLTYSRGSYVALFAGLFVWLGWQRKIKQFVLFILVGLIALWLLPKPGGEGVDLLRTISIQSRLRDSSEALRLFQSSPVFGIGFDTIRFVRQDTSVIDQSASHAGAGFHNGWLFLLATSGIAGLGAYLLMWGRLLRLSNYHQLIIVSTVAVFTHSFFDNSLFYPQVMVWLWILIGGFIKKVKD